MIEGRRNKGGMKEGMDKLRNKEKVRKEALIRNEQGVKDKRKEK